MSKEIIKKINMKGESMVKMINTRDNLMTNKMKEDTTKDSMILSNYKCNQRLINEKSLFKDCLNDWRIEILILQNQ